MAGEAGPKPDSPTRAAVDAARARIAADPDFARAPTMRRLLDFLVAETLAGHGDQLKAYAVAVDGLGRPADFDAQADSYPRVQVGRLRRMLDAYYARVPDEGIRFSIPSGRYRVLFEAPAAAIRADELALPRRVGAWLWAGLLIVLLAGAIAAGWLWRDGAPIGSARAPLLEIGPIRPTTGGRGLADSVQAVLVDGMRRSWIVRVRETDGDRGAPAYRLRGMLADGPDRLLRLRLLRADGDELVWTAQVVLPPAVDEARLAELLIPFTAELVQPYGVIASRERVRIGTALTPGYACLLQFDRYRRERSADRHAAVRGCLDATLARYPASAIALADQALLVLDEQVFGYNRQPGAVVARAAALARRAVAADPYAGRAHFVLARTAVMAGQCSPGVRSAIRATQLSPANPDLLASVGVLLVTCGDPRAEAVLLRAVTLDPAAPAQFYSPLAYLALERGDTAAARRAADAMVVTAGQNGFYDLTRAVMFAADGDVPAARAAWAEVRRADPGLAADPEATLRRFTVAPRLRALVLEKLRAAGLIPQREPSGASR